MAVVLDSPAMAPLTDRLQSSSAFQSTLREDGSGVNQDKIRFALAQVVLSFLVSALPSALLGALIYLVLARLGVARATRIIAVLAYGLFTPAFAYANAFYGHQLSAALLFAAFWLILGVDGRVRAQTALHRAAVGLQRGDGVRPRW
ncbi:MAG: hypothetical protein R2856_34650 [Caldilineaceae bacterium]